jgi:hypothetical protein
MLRFLCYLTAAGILWATEAGIAFLRTSAGIPTVIGLIIFYNFVWPPIREAVKVPFVGEVKVVVAEVDGAPGSPRGVSDYNGHVVTLTIESTLETEYEANAAICSIRGPVFYADRYGGLYTFVGAKEGYLGERRMLVTLIAVANTSLATSWYYPPRIMAAERTFGINRPTPVTHRVVYVSTTPNDFIGMMDQVEWCKIGTDARMVAADLHLATDIHGTVLRDRVIWINGDPGFPVERLIDKSVGRQIKAAIP